MVITKTPGGLLWLDLVNTEPVTGGERQDLLASGGQLLAWMRAAGLATDGLSESAAAALLPAVRTTRALLRRMAEDLEAKREASPPALGKLNELLAAQALAFSLSHENGRYRLARTDHSRRPERLLAPVAESAASFLVDGDFGRLHACQNPECTMHFYDTTKNGARVFCSPAVCGNRAKVAAFYRRKKQALHE